MTFATNEQTTKRILGLLSEVTGLDELMIDSKPVFDMLLSNSISSRLNVVTHSTCALHALRNDAYSRRVAQKATGFGDLIIMVQNNICRFGICF